MEAWGRHVPEGLREKVHVSVQVPQSDVRHLKPLILWEHQSYDQPSVQALHDPAIRRVIDHYVFVSEWQRAQYLKYFGIPMERTAIIQNAIEPIEKHVKPRGKLQLIYTSTPFRGLDVLLDAFALLDRDDVELHIYSGMSLYGAGRAAEDARFGPLYEQARRMPGVVYHGVVGNVEVHEALMRAHIFAYPNTWEETSCLSLIEALDAGCLAVIPRLGALPETASGFARLYPYAADKSEHARVFARELSWAIDHFWDAPVQQRLTQQKDFFDQNYSWKRRAEEWIPFLEEVIFLHSLRERGGQV